MALDTVVWLLKCALAGSIAVLGGAHASRESRRTAPGKQRLLRCLPVFALFSVLPLLFDKHAELASRASCAAITLWLANFKLLLLVLGRGPLADPSLTLGQFVALLLWPILHKQDASGRVMRCTETSPAELRVAALRRLVWRLPENLVISIIGFTTLVSPRVPLFLKTYSAAFGIVAYCGLWNNAVAALVMWANGLEVATGWDRPWLQNCLSDFWSRRWNLSAAYTLRALVYEPIMEGRAVRKVADKLEHTSAAPEPAPAPKTRLEPAQDLATSEIRPATPVPSPTETQQLTGSERPRAPHKQAGADGGAGGGDGAAKKHRVSPARRLLALAAVFAVSGLMHEVLLYVCTGWKVYRPVAGWQMLYFMMQVPASLVEQQLSKACKKVKWTPPDYLAIPITSLSLQVPGLFLFWNPIWTAATTALSKAH